MKREGGVYNLHSKSTPSTTPSTAGMDPELIRLTASRYLASLRRSSSSLEPGEDHCTALHRAIVGLHTEKGGNIAHLVSWADLNRSTSRTVWRHEAMLEMEQYLLPSVEQALRRQPLLAASCVRGAGVTLLHAAALLGMPRIAAALLSHGARIEARTLGGRELLPEEQPAEVEEKSPGQRAFA